MCRARNLLILGIALLAFSPAIAREAEAGSSHFVSVPSNGSSVASPISLASGATYTIIASGTVTVGNDPLTLGDAEYIGVNTANPRDAESCEPGGFVEHGIGINDSTIDGSRTPDWGVFSSENEYTTTFVGLGAPITLNYHDCHYPDNVGSFSVEIVEPPTGGIGGVLDVEASPAGLAKPSGKNFTIVSIGGTLAVATVAIAISTWLFRRRRSLG